MLGHIVVTANATQEEALQRELDSDNDSTNFFAKLDRALHAIAAHLQRYRSELNSLGATITNISELLAEKHDIHVEADAANRRVAHGLAQTASQVEATSDFSQELEKKLGNILALVRCSLSNTGSYRGLMDSSSSIVCKLRIHEHWTLFFTPYKETQKPRNDLQRRRGETVSP